MTNSVLTQSPCYARVVLSRARRELGRPNATDFSYLFSEGPHLPQVLGYLATLESPNERAVLDEISRTPPKRLRELGIVA